MHESQWEAQTKFAKHPAQTRCSDTRTNNMFSALSSSDADIGTSSEADTHDHQLSQLEEASYSNIIPILQKPNVIMFIDLPTILYMYIPKSLPYMQF